MPASSRMAPEVDETVSELSWTVLSKVKGRDWWNIALEGEGRWPTGHLGQFTREEKETLKEDEMEVGVDAPQGEC